MPKAITLNLLSVYLGFFFSNALKIGILLWIFNIIVNLISIKVISQELTFYNNIWIHIILNSGLLYLQNIHKLQIKNTQSDAFLYINIGHIGLLPWILALITNQGAYILLGLLGGLWMWAWYSKGLLYIRAILKITGSLRPLNQAINNDSTNIYSIPNNFMLKQSISLSEALIPYESKNRYTILCDNGLEYKLLEFDYCKNAITDSLRRTILGAHRNFLIKLFQDEICMCSFYKNTSWWGGEVKILLPNKNVIGRAVKKRTFSGIYIELYNADNECVLAAFGRVFNVWKYTVVSRDGVMAEILKTARNIGTELLSDADSFSVNAASTMSNGYAYLLIASVLCIDFSTFEKNQPIKPSF